MLNEFVTFKSHIIRFISITVTGKMFFYPEEWTAETKKHSYLQPGPGPLLCISFPQTDQEHEVSNEMWQSRSWA